VATGHHPRSGRSKCELLLDALRRGALSFTATLAEVAVRGTPAALTTANGMGAAGTRSATFPVFAVTFSGAAEQPGR